MKAMTARNEPMWRQTLQQRVAIQPTQLAPVLGTYRTMPVPVLALLRRRGTSGCDSRVELSACRSAHVVL